MSSPRDAEGQGRRAPGGGRRRRGRAARPGGAGLLGRPQGVRVPDVPRVEHLARRDRPGHGRRAAFPIEAPGRATAGRSWCRTGTGLSVDPPPRGRRLDNQLAFLGAALDWVADSTPRDRETRYLEARVTSWHNADPPQVEVLEAVSARSPGERARGLRRAARPRGQHAGPRPAGAGRPDRAPSPAAVPRRRARGGPIGTPSTSPTRAGTRSCRTRSTSGCCGWRRWPPSRCRSAAHPPRDGDDVRDRRLQPLPLDHALPQQPGLSGDRPRVLAVAPCGRELSVDAWLRRRRGTGARPLGAGLAVVAPAVRVRRDLRGVGLSKLVDPDWFGGTVTWQRVVRARRTSNRGRCRIGRSRPSPTGLPLERPSSSCSPSCSSLGLWWRGTRYAAVWIAVVFVTIETSAAVQVFSLLGIAVLVVWAVPSTRDRVLRIDPTSARRRRLGAVVGALDWLARFRVEPTPRVRARGRGPGRHAPRRAGGRPDAQPAAR